MSKYEYDFVALALTDDQKQVVQMGLGNIEQLNSMIKDTINSKAKQGWEAMYPFSVPYLWFRRELSTRKKTKK